MSSRMTGGIVFQSPTNNYLVGGNIINAFALGNIGSNEDFFIVSSEPTPDSNYPMITGNFLDSDGNVLFKLVQNTLVVNPGHCSKILSDRIGYEIHDANDNLILRMLTRYEKLPNQNVECWVTTIEGNFYDKNRNLVVEANGAKGFIETSVKGLIGFSNGSIGQVFGLSEQEIEVAKIALGGQGKVYQPISGRHENEVIHLEGKILMHDSYLESCELIIKNGNFGLLGGTVANCTLTLLEEATMMAHILGVKIIPMSNNQ